MNKKMVLFDFSQLFYRNTMPELNKQSKQFVDGDIKDIDYGSIIKYAKQLIIKYILLFNNKHNIGTKNYVLCCDNSSWRYNENKFYKKRRRDDKDSNIDWDQFNQGMDNVAVEIGNFLNIPVLSVDESEGDDVIASLTFKYNDVADIIIVSSDKDFKQLLCFRNLKIYDPAIDDFMTVDDPKYYLLQHILIGDSSDDIPNIYNPIDFYTNTPINKETGKKLRAVGLGEKGVEKLLGKHLDKEIRKKNFKEIREKYSKRYKENKKLIDLRHIPSKIQDAIIESYISAKSQIVDRKISRNEILKYLKNNGLSELRKLIVTGSIKL